jgi:hypothetical protein
MKYFIGDTEWYAVPCEVSSDLAFSLYNSHAGKDRSGKSLRYLVAHPNHNKGVRIRCKNYWLWGENISNRELFKRRLTGEVAKEVVEK